MKNVPLSFHNFLKQTSASAAMHATSQLSHTKRKRIISSRNTQKKKQIKQDPTVRSQWHQLLCSSVLVREILVQVFLYICSSELILWQRVNHLFRNVLSTESHRLFTSWQGTINVHLEREDVLRVSMTDQHSKKRWTWHVNKQNADNLHRLFPTNYLSRLVIEPYNVFPSFLITRAFTSHLRRLTIPPHYLTDIVTTFPLRFNDGECYDQFSQLTTLDLEGEPAQDSISTNFNNLSRGLLVCWNWVKRFPSLTNVSITIRQSEIIVVLVNWLASQVSEQLVTLCIDNCEYFAGYIWASYVSILPLTEMQLCRFKVLQRLRLVTKDLHWNICESSVFPPSLTELDLNIQTLVLKQEPPFTIIPLPNLLTLICKGGDLGPDAPCAFSNVETFVQVFPKLRSIQRVKSDVETVFKFASTANLLTKKHLRQWLLLSPEIHTYTLSPLPVCTNITLKSVMFLGSPYLVSIPPWIAKQMPTLECPDLEQFQFIPPAMITLYLLLEPAISIQKINVALQTFNEFCAILAIPRRKSQLRVLLNVIYKSFSSGSELIAALASSAGDPRIKKNRQVTDQQVQPASATS